MGDQSKEVDADDWGLRHRSCQPILFVAGRWPLTYSSFTTQPDGLGYVNRWTFGPKSQKNRNFQTCVYGSKNMLQGVARTDEIAFLQDSCKDFSGPE